MSHADPMSKASYPLSYLDLIDNSPPHDLHPNDSATKPPRDAAQETFTGASLESSLERRDFDLSAYDGDAFMKAVREGDKDRVAEIIRETDYLHPLYVCDLNYALREAAVYEHGEIIEMLVGAGACVNSVHTCEKHNKNTIKKEDRMLICIECKETALQEASKRGRGRIVEILIRIGAMVDFGPLDYRGRSAMQGAAEAGHADIVVTLIKAGADVNAHPARYDGRTALQAAADAGHGDIVATLIKAGANVNAEPAEYYGRTALQAAAEAGHTGLVATLIKAGADVNASPAKFHGRTALQAAAGAGHADIVATLIKAGADVNADPVRYYGRTALQAAAGAGHAGIVATLIKAGADVNADSAGDYGRTALQAAAGAEHAGIVATLIKAGADVNADPAVHSGRTALQAAAEAGNAEIVATLIKAGANVNATAGEAQGRTAFQAAAEAGHADIVATLIKAGADVNADQAGNYGRTALQAAAGAGNADIVATLIKAGADVNADPAWYQGRTALQAAAGAGHSEIVAALIKAGANVNADPAGSGGRTALRAAAEAGHAEIVATLIRAAGDVDANPTYRHDRTALQAAAEAGHADILAALTEASRNFDAKLAGQEGRTDIQAAAEAAHAAIAVTVRSGKHDAMNHLEGIRRQLAGTFSSIGTTQRNAKFRATTAIRHTPLLREISSFSYLDLATRGITHYKVILYLLQSGMNMNLRGIDGITPLWLALSGGHMRSASLLLYGGADTRIGDHANITPLDMVIRELDSPYRASNLALLLRFGCNIRGRDISVWNKVYNSTEATGFLAIAAKDVQLPQACNQSQGEHGGPVQPSLHAVKKTSVQITVSVELPPVVSIDSQRRRSLHYATKCTSIIYQTFRALPDHEYPLGPAQEVPKSGLCTRRWSWYHIEKGIDTSIYFSGIWGKAYPVTGFNLPVIGTIATTDKVNTLIKCEISFTYLGYDSTGEASKSIQNAFKVTPEKTEIVWIMRGDNTNTKPDQLSVPVFRTVDYVSRIYIGWVPDDSIDFFNSFVIDLHRKWRDLLEMADSHLEQSRKTLLEMRGKNAGFIEALLVDSQTWSNCRSLLQIQVRTARDIWRDFNETNYLQEEVKDIRAALRRLSQAIDNLEKEVSREIGDLAEKTQRMIELEFNLVSIFESRTSKEMGMSMKRLSWITFIFLPLMFVASLFGMNIDIVSGGPKWTWVVILAASVFTLVVSGWGMWKLSPIIFQTLQKIQISPMVERYGAYMRKSLLRKPEREKDIESGAGFEFKPPKRVWTNKLKEN